MICSMCGGKITARQENDVVGKLIRCRTIYRCEHCKRDLMYEERYI